MPSPGHVPGRLLALSRFSQCIPQKLHLTCPAWCTVPNSIPQLLLHGPHETQGNTFLPNKRLNSKFRWKRPPWQLWAPAKPTSGFPW